MIGNMRRQAVSFLGKTDRPTPLNAAVNDVRPAVMYAMVFSFFLNVLALVSPIYMLQVYDRVLTSRNQTTLLVLTLIVVFLFVVYAALEVFRTQVLVRSGIKFDSDMRSPTFTSVLDSTLLRKGGDAQAFRDVDSVREFMTGAGLIAFCDAPWIPVFVIVSFILHPFFGILAIVAGALIFALAIMNDRATREPLQQASQYGWHRRADGRCGDTAQFRSHARHGHVAGAAGPLDEAS
jgi:ABC-type protease/lipase transport system fused ATPase/permease subunit